MARSVATRFMGELKVTVIREEGAMYLALGKGATPVTCGASSGLQIGVCQTTTPQSIASRSVAMRPSTRRGEGCASMETRLHSSTIGIENELRTRG